MESDSTPVARANEDFLYPEDLEGLIPAGLTGEDSVGLVEKYAQDWVRKQLMIARALGEIQYNEAEIERKVLDYKYSLIVH
ncbi:MAG: peptidyl-prolyl cis-trans isomerase, partial [Bacteroidota bacterium]